MMKKILCPVCGGWGHIVDEIKTSISCRECKNCLGTGRIEVPKTNAERLDEMNVEEKAKYLVFKVKCTSCNAENCDEEFCLNLMRDWLRR